MVKLQPPTHTSAQIGQMLDRAMDQLKVPADERDGMREFLVHAALAEGGNCATQKCLTTGDQAGFFGTIKSTWEGQRKLLGLSEDKRTDPYTECLVAVNFTKSNGQAMQKLLGHSLSSADFYIAHFLGAGGAHNVITHPDTKLGALLPANVFAGNPIHFNGKNLRDFTYADLHQWAEARMSLNPGARQAYWDKVREHTNTAADDDQETTDEKDILHKKFGFSETLLNGLGKGILYFFSLIFSALDAATAPGNEHATPTPSADVVNRLQTMAGGDATKAGEQAKIVATALYRGAPAPSTQVPSTPISYTGSGTAGMTLPPPQIPSSGRVNAAVLS